MNSKEHIKLSNQSLVFEVFGEDEKLTISELTFRANEKLDETKRLSEQTIRRAVSELCQSGFLKPFGKSNNAQTYGKVGATFKGNLEDKLIPFGGNLVTVEEFIRTMADPDQRPLRRKQVIIGERAQHNLRRLMILAVTSSQDPGYNDSAKKINEMLHDAIDEMEYAIDILKNFVNSPVWYPTYRDRIALNIRKVTEKDPDLIQMADDYTRSER